MPTQGSKSVPQAMQPVYEAITTLIDTFCSQHLNNEYAVLARQLTAALARKRPSPLARGKPDIWAAGIVHALGTVNFLFDPTQTPHLRSSDLSQLFGVNQNTTANKAKLIREMFNMHHFDHQWCLPSRLESSSPLWFIMVNGYIVDAREMPREVQEIAYEKGLIPYIPADRQAE